MKMLTATRVAALAVGLSLVAGQAFAADESNDRGRRHNNDNTASDQQDQNDQGDRNRRGQKRQAPPATVAPAPAVAPVVQPTPTGRWQDRNRRGANDNRRGQNDQVNDQGNNNPYARNNNDRRDWGKQDRRRVDVRQYRRNFKAERRFRANPYNWYAGYSYHRYGYGQRLPRQFFARNFWLANFYNYGLFAPPPGYVWVRYGPDALLIDIETGEIVQVQYDMFYS